MLTFLEEGLPKGADYFKGRRSKLEIIRRGGNRQRGAAQNLLSGFGGPYRYAVTVGSVDRPVQQADTLVVQLPLVIPAQLKQASQPPQEYPLQFDTSSVHTEGGRGPPAAAAVPRFDAECAHL
jgi:hypothetical protein